MPPSKQHSMTASPADRVHTTQDWVQCAHDDLKQVNVHTSALRMAYRDSDPFTVYTLIVSCASTKAWWVIRKRYSHFYALRQTLVEKMRTMSKTKSIYYSDLQLLLQPIVKFPFPKKCLRLDTVAIMTHRKNAFTTITTMLMQLRSAMLVLAVRQANNKALVDELNDLRSKLDTFLGVPDRQVVEEAHRMSLRSSSSSEPEHTHEPNDDECPICLFALKEPSENGIEERVVRMGCSHAFHESCVVQWLERKPSCPMCRQYAVDGVIF
ncbi:hypothetical protein H310_06698 [Aphanomyces invadans]|uniref:RING-type domain-containing protein n=1 Tax=Aphanomyces invadans TaxID=157072 RepID=A0A024U597_9STRA|nr:hypothetical protein H310_06698 [Aphanomyces invadans]ETW01072.1 hypothetical protein H310_06698 [Aphanomyces invadans]|eukprot:XP_008870070.1 hypothetical protein H310_06698 [Aphanomyces invadans]